MRGPMYKHFQRHRLREISRAKAFISSGCFWKSADVAQREIFYRETDTHVHTRTQKCTRKETVYTQKDQDDNPCVMSTRVASASYFIPFTFFNSEFVAKLFFLAHKLN